MAQHQRLISTLAQGHPAADEAVKMVIMLAPDEEAGSSSS
jgi:hypothetical protein